MQIKTSFALKIYLFLFLFLSAPFLFAQEEITIKNGINYDPALVPPFLRTLHEQNDHVISFRVKLPSPSVIETDYFILTRLDNKIHAFSYSIKTNALAKMDLGEHSLELIWKTFVQNELFKISDEKDVANFCALKYHIYNSYTYEFTILSQDRMKILSYYNPEYYDEVCFGMAERRKVINSASVIQYVLSGGK